MPPTETEILDRYRASAAEFAHRGSAIEGQARLVAHGRLLAFLAAVAAGVWAEWTADAAATAWTLAASFALAFVALILWHGRLRERQRWFQELERLNEEAMARVRREWDALPRAGAAGVSPDHPYAADLDIFGRASVQQLLGEPGTAPGRETLRAWLLGSRAAGPGTAPPADAAGASPETGAAAGGLPDDVAYRQEAVHELAGRLDLRQEVLARGRLGAGLRRSDLDRFRAWTDEPDWLRARPLLRWGTRVLPVAVFALIGLNIAGVLSFHFWATLVVFQAVLSRIHERRLHDAFDRASPREAVFSEYPQILRRLESAEFEAPMLRASQAGLRAGPEPAHRAIGRLDRLTHLSNMRLTRLAHFPVQSFTLWDYHVLAALERWRRAVGPHFHRWFDALGRFEALSALAGLAHDNPDWAFPEIVADEPRILRATSLAHPLLPRETRVANDVELGPPGTFLLVTGSNMSGKSTLLRAVGVNVVLGQAGGPVCAAAMRLPPLDVVTSMRVQDSLEEGVSFFMAGLLRLKQVVDAARRDTRGPRTLLYLLDEILQGTNTAERRAAVLAIIRFLLDQDAIGAVTTHDLALAKIEELESASRLVHFRETVAAGDNGPAMRFDYRLRPGVATSVNALRLMEIVGLPVEDATAPARRAPGPRRAEDRSR